MYKFISTFCCKYSSISHHFRYIFDLLLKKSLFTPTLFHPKIGELSRDKDCWACSCGESWPKTNYSAPISSRPGPILSLTTITFELHAKMVEEIDLEKCNFRNFTSSVTLTLTLDRVEVIRVGISGRGLPMPNLIDIGNTFCRSALLNSTGHTRVPIFIRSSPGDDLIKYLLIAYFLSNICAKIINNDSRMSEL